MFRTLYLLFLVPAMAVASPIRVVLIESASASAEHSAWMQALIEEEAPGVAIVPLKQASSLQASYEVLGQALALSPSVLVLGYGHEGYDAREKELLLNIWRQGSLIFAPAGNAGSSQRWFPAGYAFVQAVGGTGRHASRYQGVQVVSDSEALQAPRGSGLRGTVSGSSYAAARVAGLAAARLGAGQTPEALRHRLKGQGGRRLGSNDLARPLPASKAPKALRPVKAVSEGRWALLLPAVEPKRLRRRLLALGGRPKHDFGRDGLVAEIDERGVAALKREGLIGSAYRGAAPPLTGKRGLAAQVWNDALVGQGALALKDSDFGPGEPLQACAEPVERSAQRQAALQPMGLHIPSPPLDGAPLFSRNQFLAGRVAVGIVMPQSNGVIDPVRHQWTPLQVSRVLEQILLATAWHQAQNPSAQIEFVYELQVAAPCDYEPINYGLGSFTTWINNTLAKIDPAHGTLPLYYEHLRSSLNADWAIVAVVIDDLGCPECYGRTIDAYSGVAFVGLNTTMMTYQVGSWGIGRMAQVAAHEFGHLFGAPDEYGESVPSPGDSPSLRTGYYHFPNDNSDFGGPVNDPVCLMRGGGPTLDLSTVCSATHMHWGWRDVDNDGKVDVLDTQPVLQWATPTASVLSTGESLTLHGVAQDQPEPADPGAAPIYNSVTINSILAVEFRVNGGAWQPGEFTDGGGDESSEGFSFNTGPLVGDALIEARAMNSAGNYSAVLARNLSVRTATSTPTPNLSATLTPVLSPTPSPTRSASSTQTPSRTPSPTAWPTSSLGNCPGPTGSFSASVLGPENDGSYPNVAADALHLYVVDAYKHRVRILDRASGSILAQTGSYGALPLQFNGPMGVAVDGSYVYVVDQFNNRVQVLGAHDLSYVGSFGGAGVGLGQLIRPAGVAVDADRIYVTEDGNLRVQVFDKFSFAPLASFGGSYGSGPYQFLNCQGIAVDATRLYVGDPGRGTVKVYDKHSLSFLYEAGSRGQGVGQFAAQGLIAADGGLLFAPDHLRGVILVFSGSTLVTEIDSYPGLPRSVARFGDSLYAGFYGGVQVYQGCATFPQLSYTPSPSFTASPNFSPTRSPVVSPTLSPTPSPVFSPTPSPSVTPLVCSPVMGRIQADFVTGSVGEVYYTQVTLDNAATVTALEFAESFANINDCSFILGVYANAGGEPGARLAQSPILRVTTGPGLFQVPIGPLALSAGTYWLAIAKNGGWYLGYGGGIARRQSFAFGSLPASASGLSSASAVAIRALACEFVTRTSTQTASPTSTGTPEFPVGPPLNWTHSSTRTPSPTLSPTPSISPTATSTASPSHSLTVTPSRSGTVTRSVTPTPTLSPTSTETVVIPTSTPVAACPHVLGNTGAPSTYYTSGQFTSFFAPYTAASSGWIDNISVSLGGGPLTNTYNVGIYSDAGGVPGSLLASSPLFGATFGSTFWVIRGTLSSPFYVNAGTTYWLAYYTRSTSGSAVGVTTGHPAPGMRTQFGTLSLPTTASSSNYASTSSMVISAGFCAVDTPVVTSTWTVSPTLTATRTPTISPTFTPVCPILLGSSANGGNVYMNAGTAHFSPYVAAASSGLAWVEFKLNPGPYAANIQVAVYSDEAGSPGTRLGASAVQFVNATGSNPTVRLDLSLPIPVTAGVTYWVAVLGDTNGGNLNALFSGSPLMTKFQTGLASLPLQAAPSSSSSAYSIGIRAGGCDPAPSFTVSPTASPTETVLLSTRTNTPTPSATRSATPFISATPTPTVTRSPTAMATVVPFSSGCAEIMGAHGSGFALGGTSTQYFYCPYVAAYSGPVNFLRYQSIGGGSGGLAKLALYSNAGGLPSTLLAQTPLFSTEAGWAGAALGSEVNVVYGQTYWIAISAESTAGSVLYGVDGNSSMYTQAGSTFAATASPLLYISDRRLILAAIYCFATPTPTASRSATPSPTASPTPAFCALPDSFTGGAYEAPWSPADLGSVSNAQRLLGSGSLTLGADSAGGLSGSADSGVFLLQAVGGDFDVRVRLSDAPSGSGALSGLALRESVDPQSKAVFMAAVSGGFRFGARTAYGAVPTLITLSDGPAAPIWLRLTRQGSSFKGYYSFDNALWVPHGGLSMGFSASAQIGLVYAGNAAPGQARFNDLSIASGGCAFATPTSTFTPSQSPEVSPTPSSTVTLTANLSDTLTPTPTLSPAITPNCWSPLAVWQGSAFSGVPAGPQGLAVDGTHHFAVDRLGGRVLVLDLAGTLVTELSVAEPQGIAVAGGVLYVSDRSSDRVLRFDAISFAPLSAFGSSGSSLGQLRDPGALAVAGAELFVADAGNARVHVFDLSTGSGLRLIGSNGSSDGQFQAPSGLALGPLGLYVADEALDRVQRFDATSGAYLGKFGTPGHAEGQFSSPRGLRWKGGYLYVADGQNQRIQVFDTQAGHAWTASLALAGTANDLSLSPGRLHAAQAGAGIAVFDACAAYSPSPTRSPSTTHSPSATRTATGSPTATRTATASRTPTHSPSATVSGTRTVSPTATSTATVTPSGTPSPSPSVTPSATPTLTQTPGELIYTVVGTGVFGPGGDGIGATSVGFSSPYGQAVDSDGNLYFSSIGDNRLYKRDTAGIVTIIANAAGIAGGAGDGGQARDAQLNGPGGIGIDAAGNLYVAEYLGHRVRKIAPNGVISLVAGTGSAGFNYENGSATGAQLWNPLGVAADNMGNVYIADINNQRLRKVDNLGQISTLHALSGLAAGVCWGSDGKLYYSEITRIWQHNGVSATVYAGTGVGGTSGDGGLATSAQIQGVVGIAMGPDGTLYLASQDTHDIRAIDPASGIIRRHAGRNGAAYSGDGGQALDAQLNLPSGLAVDAYNNLYVGDVNNNVVRRIGNHAVPSPTQTKTVSTTASPTNTPTATATFSPIVSATGTVTPVLSATSTQTATSAVSPIVSSTSTVTPVLSATSTQTATSTVSPFVSSTSTVTPVLSATSTQTATSTVSPVVSATSTVTPVLSATSTQTATSTVSPVISYTSTVTSTATQTATPSMTPTGTAQGTLTHSPTISPTYSVSPTYTDAPTPLPFAVSSDGQLHYGPVPASQRQPLCLYGGAAIQAARATLYNANGERVIEADGLCLSLRGLAPGIYYLLGKVQLVGAGEQTITQKLFVTP